MDFGSAEVTPQITVVLGDSALACPGGKGFKHAGCMYSFAGKQGSLLPFLAAYATLETREAARVVLLPRHKFTPACLLGYLLQWL